MEYAYKEGWWETKDHRKIRISDMEMSHIENTIKYLQRHDDFYDKAYGVANGPDCYDYEDNSELVYKKIDELKEELDRRKREYEIFLRI